MRWLAMAAFIIFYFSPGAFCQGPRAAWQTNGIVVNNTPGNTPQQNPQVIVTSENEFILAWEDGRLGFDNIYAQKIDARGRPLWGKDGVPAGKGPGNQNFPRLVSDGAGGAIIVWQDYRHGNSDIYAQRIEASGQPLWQSGGEVVCAAPAGQFAPDAVSDGAGGAIIVWHDYRGSRGEDIYAQRINNRGESLWEKDGILVSGKPGTQWYPRAASDQSGGAIVVWTEDGSGPADKNIAAQRIGPGGKLLWQEGGKLICQAKGNQESPEIINVAGGAIISWKDMRADNRGIYLQKIDYSGSLLWQTDGVAASLHKHDQDHGRLSDDGAGGAILVWTDYRQEQSQIYAQRIYNNGLPAWQENGRLVSSIPSNKKFPEITKIGPENWIIIWQDARKGRMDYYFQKINSSGTPLMDTAGVPAVDINGDQHKLAAAAGRDGGVLIAWEDYRAGSPDIYAQKISAQGERLFENSGVVVCAAEGSVVQKNMAAAFNTFGDIIVVFEDARSGFLNIYAQKISRGGELAWGKDGTAVAKIDAEQKNPRIIADRNGGVFICWEDYRVKDSPQIRLQRLNSLGKSVWQSSLAPTLARSGQTNPVMVSDSAGGIIVAWEDNRDVLSLQDLYLQRISDKGGLLWDKQGAVLISANGDQVNADMAEDPAGGAIIVWTDYRRGDRNPDIYGQKINNRGELLWASGGLQVCGAPDVQREPRVVSDGSGGAVVAWTDRGSGSYDIYAQKIDRSGKALWLKDGIPVCQAGRTQQNARFGGNNVLVWEDYRWGNWDIFASAFDQNGKIIWDPSGTPVVMVPQTQYAPYVANWKEGRVIIAWEDYRSGKHYEIYAQMLDQRGNNLWPVNGVKIRSKDGGRAPRLLASPSENSLYVFWEDYSGGGRAIYGQRYLIH